MNWKKIYYYDNNFSGQQKTYNSLEKIIFFKRCVSIILWLLLKLDDKYKIIEISSHHNNFLGQC